MAYQSVGKVEALQMLITSRLQRLSLYGEKTNGRTPSAKNTTFDAREPS